MQLFPVGSQVSANTLSSPDQSGTTQADANFSTGNLVLNNVPNKFDFGTLPISTDTVTQSLPKENNYDLTVTDTRGTENGYRVTASAKPMASLDGKYNLDGNNIHLTNPIVSQVTKGPKATAPTANNDFYADKVDEKGETVPSWVSTAKAHSTQGSLTWKTSWNGSNINFVVQPDEAKAVQYRTNIVWTLTDAPD